MKGIKNDSEHMKYWTTIVLILVSCAYASNPFPEESRLYTGIIKAINKDHIVLINDLGCQSHIGFVCDIEICNSTKEYSTGDEVLLVFGSVKRADSIGRINKLIGIRSCLTAVAECMHTREEKKKSEGRSKIEDNKYIELQLDCRSKMYLDLKSDSRYIADNWMTRIQRFTVDRNTDFDNLADSNSTTECLDNIFKAHYDAVVEVCEKHGCGDRIGGGCEHIASYSGTDALDLHAIKQCQ